MRLCIIGCLVSEMLMTSNVLKYERAHERIKDGYVMALREFGIINNYMCGEMYRIKHYILLG